MTTTEIATFADPEGLASPDISLQAELRRNVMPDFYEQIGEVGWRRRYGNETVAAGVRYFTLPMDFGDLKGMVPALPYIGDNSDLVLAAEANETAGTSSGYYIDWMTSPFPTLMLSGPTSEQTVFRFTYISRINFLNDTTTLQLDAYIPKQHQWALVIGLRRVLYERRYGVGDKRYLACDAEYSKLIKQAKKNPEKTGQERYRYVD